MSDQATLTEKDIKKLQQIHLKRTGQLLSDQETLELGLRIKEFVKLIVRPIPDESI